MIPLLEGGTNPIFAGIRGDPEWGTVLWVGEECCGTQHVLGDQEGVFEVGGPGDGLAAVAGVT